MEMLEPSVIALLALVAFAAGFIDAVAGGGGMLTIPALLAAGLPPHLALGTNKLSATFASSTAAITYYRKKLFSPLFWKDAFWATLIGSIIGTCVVSFISTEWLNKILPLIILSTAIYSILHRPKLGEENVLPAHDPKLTKKQRLQGLSLGFYDGAIGPGTGAFWVVSNMALYKINMLLASGVAKAMNFTSNATSLVTFAIFGTINWELGLTMGVCLMAGAYLGAHSAIKFGAKFIRPVFICVVTVMAAKLAYDAWF